jgi:NTE family protein
LKTSLLHGGGSLGAFGCGVFKVIVKNNVKIDIIAGWNEFGHVAASLNPRLVLHY